MLSNECPCVLIDIRLRHALSLLVKHFCQIIISVATSVNASWHVCLTCQLLELLCDNSNCKGIIIIKANIYSL